MKRAVNYLRGTATLTARGLFPERLLNLCAQEGVACWALEWTDSHTMRLTPYRRSLPQLRRLLLLQQHLLLQIRRTLPHKLLPGRSAQVQITL